MTRGGRASARHRSAGGPFSRRCFMGWPSWPMRSLCSSKVASSVGASHGVPDQHKAKFSFFGEDGALASMGDTSGLCRSRVASSAGTSHGVPDQHRVSFTRHASIILDQWCICCTFQAVALCWVKGGRCVLGSWRTRPAQGNNFLSLGRTACLYQWLMCCTHEMTHFWLLHM